jgi:basic membrane protein A
MPSHSRLLAVICLAAACALLAACGSPATGPGSPASTSSGPGASGKSVTFVADTGGLDDHGYNEYTYLGVKAGAAAAHIGFHVIQTVSSSDYVSNLTTAARQSGLVIMAGFDFGPALQTVSAQFPKVDFVIEDFSYSPPLPNVQGDVFEASQSSYLGGIVAAGMSSDHTIGFVGGVKESVLEQFLAGYEAGALSYDPQTHIKVVWTGSFSDQQAGKEAAQTEIAQGADVIFAAAGASGLGSLAAARQAGKYAIGVDSDQNYLAPQTIVTSVVKNLSVVAADNVRAYASGTWKAGTAAYDVANDGVGLAPWHAFATTVPAAVKTAVTKAEQEMKGGTLHVPTVPQYPNGR